MNCVLALRLLTTIQIWMVEATFRPPKFGAIGGKALFHRRWFSYLDFGFSYHYQGSELPAFTWPLNLPCPYLKDGYKVRPCSLVFEYTN